MLLAYWLITYEPSTVINEPAENIFIFLRVLHYLNVGTIDAAGLLI